MNVIGYFPKQIDHITFSFKIQSHFVFNIFKQPHHSNCWSWINRALRVLIIKTYVAAGNRCIKFSASLTHSFDSMHELIIYLGIVRITKVEAVCHAKWPSPATDNVSGGLAYRNHCSFIRISKNITAVTVSSYCQRLLCFFNDNDRCVSGCVS